MEHPLGIRIELFVVNSPEVSADEREKIQDHLEVCCGCREAQETIQSFYKNLDEELEKGVTSRDKELARKILGPSAEDAEAIFRFVGPKI